VPPDLTIVLKVQPNQVHRQALRQILRTHGVGAIFLVRRRLDQYISLRKARAIGAWFGTDTTDIRPTVGAAQFLAWSGALDDWLSDMAALCRQAGIGAIQFDYEQDLQSVEQSDLAEKLGPRLTQVGLRVKTGDLMGETYFNRQDTGQSPFDKVGNSTELRAALDALGLTDYGLSKTALCDAADPVAPDRTLNLIDAPDVAAQAMLAGDFATVRRALNRIGRDIAPGPYRLATLPQSAGMFERPIFICGLHRSGTTLVHDRLAALSDVATLRHDKAPRSEGQFLQDVMAQEHPFGGPGYFGFASVLAAKPVSHPDDAARIASTLRRQWAAHMDRPACRLLLEKSPPNLVRIAFLRSLFPGARFVIVVRNPRAVAMATRKWRPEASLDLLLAHWQSAHMTALAQLEADCTVLRYEDLCNDPDATLLRVATFCALPLRDTPLPLPQTARDIVSTNPAYLESWPQDVSFQPTFQLWRIFGYGAETGP